MSDRTMPSALTAGRRVLEIEAAEISRLAARLDDQFERAIRLILDCPGRIIVSGLGKSGHVGRKIAATLASTGTPSYFVHAAEAVHGDLGMITGEDVLIAISNSGEGDELLTIVPLFKRLGGKLVAITGNVDSSLAQEADVHLDAHVEREACPLNLAPTASTTVALALGDALAVALLEARGFGADDFARSHPGGSLGRKLLTHVSDVMRTDIARISSATSVPQALAAMTQGGMGMVVIHTDNAIVGIFTDGDLRRAMEKFGDLRHVAVNDVMTRNPRTIEPQRLAIEAVQMMEEHKINQLLVVDAKTGLVGALNMHDLFQAKVV